MQLLCRCAAVPSLSCASGLLPRRCECGCAGAGRRRQRPGQLLPACCRTAAARLAPPLFPCQRHRARSLLTVLAPQIDTVIAACRHRGCTRALFSATLPEAVENLARSVLKDPLRVTVGERNTGE